MQELGGQAASLLQSAHSSVKLRNISDPLTWVFCFLSFMVASTDSEATRNMAAYAQIIIQTARKHPKGGWLTYDQQFRQQRAAGAELPWNDICSSLMAATILRSVETCSLCHAPDHSTEQCALFVGQDPPRSSNTSHPTSSGRYQQFRPYTSNRRSGFEETCKKFNKGTCTASSEDCKYNHNCLSCGKHDHGAWHCPDDKRPEPKGNSRASTSSSTAPPFGHLPLKGEHSHQ